MNGFAIDQTEVTVKAFSDFTSATGYVTEAEAFGWSFVFHQLLSDEEYDSADEAVLGAEWWIKVKGANWRQPAVRSPL